MEKKFKIGIVGATGAVGSVLISVLQERKFPVAEVVPFASERSKGKSIRLYGKDYRCRLLEMNCFVGLDMVFFDASDAISREWAPRAAKEGAWVIDNSGVHRMDIDVPLIVPEVNGGLIEAQVRKTLDKAGVTDEQKTKIIAGPNCTVAPLVLVLKPILEAYGLKRIVVSTYQSVSGAGAEAMRELKEQTAAYLKEEAFVPTVFDHTIAFNCIPHIGSFVFDGKGDERRDFSTSEELKLVDETRKILNRPQLAVSATAVRVPTFSCHAESVNIECDKDFQINDIRTLLEKQPGVVVMDDPRNRVYPMGQESLKNRSCRGATGQDPTFVGRIRRDYSIPFGLNLWLVSDNLRKGAALNAVQIGENLLKYLH